MPAVAVDVDDQRALLGRRGIDGDAADLGQVGGVDRPDARTVAITCRQVHVGAGQPGAGDDAAVGRRRRQRGLQLGERAAPGGEVGEDATEGALERARRGDGLRLLRPVGAELGIGGDVGAGGQHGHATVDRGRLGRTDLADEQAGVIADRQPAGGAAQPDRAADQQADGRLVELRGRRRRDRVGAEPEVTADRDRADGRARAQLAGMTGEHREAVGGVERVGRLEDGRDRERRRARGGGRVARRRRGGRVDRVHGRTLRVRRAGRWPGGRGGVRAPGRGVGRAGGRGGRVGGRGRRRRRRGRRGVLGDRDDAAERADGEQRGRHDHHGRGASRGRPAPRSWCARRPARVPAHVRCVLLCWSPCQRPQPESRTRTGVPPAHSRPREYLVTPRASRIRRPGPARPAAPAPAALAALTALLPLASFMSALATAECSDRGRERQRARWPAPGPPAATRDGVRARGAPRGRCVGPCRWRPWGSRPRRRSASAP